MSRVSKVKKEEMEKKAQITGSPFHDYLQIKDSLPLTKELINLLINKGFVISTIGQTYHDTQGINHLTFIKGHKDERVFLTIHKKKVSKCKK